MVEYIVVYWKSTEKIFNYKHFLDLNDAVEFANKNKKERFDIIIVKNIDGKYHLMNYGYSKIYYWQNKILNLMSFLIIVFICYLYLKIMRN